MKKKDAYIYLGIIFVVIGVLIYLYTSHYNKILTYKDNFLSYFTSEEGTDKNNGGNNGDAEAADIATSTEATKNADGVASAAANATYSKENPKFRNESNEHYCASIDREEIGIADDTPEECAAHTHKWNKTNEEDCPNHRGKGYCHWVRDSELARERNKPES